MRQIIFGGGIRFFRIILLSHILIKRFLWSFMLKIIFNEIIIFNENIRFIIIFNENIRFTEIMLIQIILVIDV